MGKLKMSDKAKILYIEDNAANLDLVQRVLHSTGRYEVISAMDGETGLSMIIDQRPSLVLVDLDIPGVNGFEVLRQIKQSSDPDIARIPVAIVTANVVTHERERALDEGCAAFIEKPFDIRDFRDEIGRLVDSARAAEGE